MEKKESSFKDVGKDQSTNYFQNIRPPTFEDMEKSFWLSQLNIEEKPHYLELPIKMETRTIPNSKPRKESESYSQDLLNEIREYNEKNSLSNYNEMLLSEEDHYDMIDELLLPLSNQQLQPSSKFLQLENIISNESQSAIQMQAQKSEKPTIDPLPFSTEQNQASDKETIYYRKLLLSSINNFKACNNGLIITMNFHSLMKKDSVNKMYGSILGVLNKEGKKMERELFEELKDLSISIRNIKKDRGEVDECLFEEQIIKQADKKGLLSTMADEGKITVKVEHIDYN